MKEHSPSFVALAKEAKSHIEETDIYTVKKMMDNEEDFELVDVREESEWDEGHLPSAIHLGKGIIERDIEKVIPNRNRKLILYCGGGFRSALAAESIKKMGYKNVLSMDGGFRTWREAGFPIIMD
ncbi:rhodanese-like domain-containing protein [Coxiella burnetii]|uniref:rhodanese-like domain-containing protein n=1 Tax=Coxiella burnetii TaxID=777 RepID=UPI0005096BCE|nr:rhodanese-like domain-containing protein [Coxiella burnetii]